MPIGRGLRRLSSADCCSTLLLAAATAAAAAAADCALVLPFGDIADGFMAITKLEWSNPKLSFGDV